ncbi:MAG: branched-chain amino acid ABC transporter permease [Burkholderiales bacterium]
MLKFPPTNVGRYALWGGFALVLAALPLVFRQGFAITIMSQMGIFIIAALSYNMLLGQTGLLSFGHSVYSGLGAYFAIHTLNWIAAGKILLPVALVPLVGGLVGLVFAILFGYITTKKAGTTFAMITLGIGEMVFAASLIFPSFFGGEGGISANRVVGKPFLGLTYGPAVQVYYLIATWTLVAMIAMFALTQTPLGRLANAVRDNPERVEFIGYNTHVVRFMMFALSGFFAGIAGGLSAINFEIVSAESVGAQRSGGMLVAAYIGGVGVFFGPVIGAIIFTFFVVAISNMTKAWLLYLGLFFVAIVMVAPGGIASVVLMNLRVWKAGFMNRLWKPYAAVLATGLIALVGFVMVVEMTYKISDSGTGGKVSVFGVQIDAGTQTPWIVAAVVLTIGGFLYRRAWVASRRRWDEIQVLLQTRSL